MKKIITIIIAILCVQQMQAQAWKRIFRDSSYTFIDIQCTGGSVVYILYNNDQGSNYIKRSSDGGKTWKDILLSGLQNPQRLLMRDDNTGYIIGVTGAEARVTLLSTKDGFDTYSTSQFDSAYFVMGMGFVDDSTGFYLNNEGRLRRILGGGKSYEYIANDLQRSYMEVVDGVIYLVGNGVIERSLDTGKTWTTMNDTADQSITNVRFTNRDIGYFLVANGMSKGFIDVTHNGGKTFARTEFTGGHISVNKGLAAVCGTLDDAVTFTRDFGKTWTKENTGYNGFRTAISLQDSTCYMLTANGEIVKRFMNRKAPTGINSTETKPVCTIYPVPASDKLHIDFHKGFIEGGRVEMYDHTGRKVFSEQVGNISWSLDVSGLPRGIYSVHVHDDSGILHSVQIIIQ